MTSDRLGELQRVIPGVSRETCEKLDQFEQIFKRWSARMNLASASQLEQLWTRHILDSAQLIRFAPETLRWLDIGSGGGFPGAVLTILLDGQDGFRIDLIESNRKKAAFLKTALAGYGGVAVHPLRVEAAYGSIQTPEIVTARAVAPLHILLGMASPWLVSGARGLFHKGREYLAEIEEARDAWQFDLIEHRSMVDREGVILEIRDLHARQLPA